MAKAKQFRHTLRVRGNGIFPFDMLRYDGVTVDPTDKAGMAFVKKSNDPAHFHELLFDPKTRTVRVVATDTRKWEPTAARWRSFGWTVVDHAMEEII